MLWNQWKVNVRAHCIMEHIFLFYFCFLKHAWVQFVRGSHTSSHRDTVKYEFYCSLILSLNRSNRLFFTGKGNISTTILFVGQYWIRNFFFIDKTPYHIVVDVNKFDSVWACVFFGHSDHCLVVHFHCQYMAFSKSFYKTNLAPYPRTFYVSQAERHVFSYSRWSGDKRLLYGFPRNWGSSIMKYVSTDRFAIELASNPTYIEVAMCS